MYIYIHVYREIGQILQYILLSFLCIESKAVVKMDIPFDEEILHV